MDEMIIKAMVALICISFVVLWSLVMIAILDAKNKKAQQECESCEDCLPGSVTVSFDECDENDSAAVPVASIGPSGLGGDCQREIYEDVMDDMAMLSTENGINYEY